MQGPEAGRSSAAPAAVHLGAGSHGAGANPECGPARRHRKSNKVSLGTLQGTARRNESWVRRRLSSADKLPLLHYISEVMSPVCNSLQGRFIRAPRCKALWEEGTQVNTSQNPLP